MKKLFTKERLSKVAVLALAVVVMGVPAFAGELEGEFESVIGKSGVLGQVLSMMFTAFILIGAATLIFGAIQLGFAFKNDDADGKAKGMRAAIAGAIVLTVGMSG